MVSTSSCIWLLLLLAIHRSVQKSNPASLTYRAAVVELEPVLYHDDIEKMWIDNTKKVVGFIEQAAKMDVDIVVFPELALTSLVLPEKPDLRPSATLIPDPSQNFTPCTNFSIPIIEALRKIACATEQNSIYVVVNLLEKEICSGKDCPSDGTFVFITNVALDRKGKIIARYRKAHLVDEYVKINVIKPPESSTFDTDFGVTFGNLICLDIMYEEPWMTLTRKLNITDIIHTSGWYNKGPFLTTIQMEVGWAYDKDVNLLSSGYNKVEWGNSGSGIYAGRQGILAAILPLDHCDEMLVADVPKKANKNVTNLAFQSNLQNHVPSINEDYYHHMQDEIRQEHHSRVFKWRYENLDGYETEVIAKNGTTVQALSHNRLYCKFQVNVTSLRSPVTYRLLAFDGILSDAKPILLGVRICAIIQCANDTIDSCGHIQNSSAIFHSSVVTAICDDNSRTVMMPNSLGTDVLPLKNWTFNQYKQKEYIYTSMLLTKSTQNLVTFGVWGRNFEKDQTGSASRIYNQLLYIPFLLIFFKNICSFL